MSMPSVSGVEAGQPVPLLKNLYRASQDTSGLVKKKKTTRSIRVERPSAKAKPFTTPIAKMYSTIAASSGDRVGGQTGVPGPAPAGLDCDAHRLAFTHLVSDPLEVDDEGVSCDADSDDQSGDAGQGEREAGRLAQEQDHRVGDRRGDREEATTTSPRPR